jgi:enamine deaminase RidA (YjgF/YER057c/UK114 family)
MSPEEKIRELGIELPVTPAPLGSYIPCTQAGNLLYLSGILPFRDGLLTRTGRVGENITLDEARDDARTVAINALSVLKAYTGSLNKITRCIRITGYVASSPGFTEQPKVLNAASDLLFEIFGEAGRHARSAVGVNVLPLNAPVEIECIFEVS